MLVCSMYVLILTIHSDGEANSSSNLFTSSQGSDLVARGRGRTTTKVQRVFRPFRYSLFEEESSSSSESESEGEVDEEVDKDTQSPSTSKGRKRSCAQPKGGHAELKKSPAEADHGNGKVTAHKLECKFVYDVAVDAYKDTTLTLY